MHILMVSPEAEGVGIAHRLVQEGHKVDLWIKDQRYKNTLRNIVNRPAAWRPLLPIVDLVIFDTVGWSHLKPLLGKLGKPCLVCNGLADMIELDRQKGMETLTGVGIQVPPYEIFQNPDEAKTLLKRWRGPGYVIKPFNNEDVGKTYLCSDPAIYEWALSTYSTSSKLLVQELIKNAIEISTEGWYNGAGWITPFNHTFEEKPLMSGGIGKLTGCMGNVVKTVEKPNKLIESTLFKIESFLKNFSYRGPIDINCLVTKDELMALEFTCRFGYDAIEALMEGLKEPVGSMLFDVASGTKKQMDITQDLMIAVRVSKDPYPFAYPADIKEPDAGMPLVGINEKNLKHIFLTDVYLTADGYKYAAGDGVLYKATARGRDVKEARQRVYTTISNIHGLDLQWRNDIGLRFEQEWNTLHNWGWV